MAEPRPEDITLPATQPIEIAIPQQSLTESPGPG